MVGQRVMTRDRRARQAPGQAASRSSRRGTGGGALSSWSTRCRLLRCWSVGARGSLRRLARVWTRVFSAGLACAWSSCVRCRCLRRSGRAALCLGRSRTGWRCATRAGALGHDPCARKQQHSNQCCLRFHSRSRLRFICVTAKNLGAILLQENPADPLSCQRRYRTAIFHVAREILPHAEFQDRSRYSPRLGIEPATLSSSARNRSGFR